MGQQIAYFSKKKKEEKQKTASETMEWYFVIEI